MADRGNSDGSRVWLLDGFNVLHAGWRDEQGPGSRDGWWRRDRRDRLLERIRGFDDADAELWVVFDGDGAPRPPAQEQEQEQEAGTDGSRLRVVYAPSADEWIVQQVKRAEMPGAWVVVTGDRRLADRCRHHGARVVSPRRFLARCGPAPAGRSAAPPGG